MGPSSSLIIIPPVSSAVFQLFLIKTSGDSGLRCKIIMVRQATSKGYCMSRKSVSDEAKAVVRRSTEEVQGKGRFDVFEELFAHDFVDHTTQPGTTPDKAGYTGAGSLEWRPPAPATPVRPLPLVWSASFSVKPASG